MAPFPIWDLAVWALPSAQTVATWMTIWTLVWMRRELSLPPLALDTRL